MAQQQRIGDRSAGLDPHREVREVVLTARSERGELALVRFDDGGWGITRDQQHLTSLYWPDGLLDPCIETFLRLAELSEPTALV